MAIPISHGKFYSFESDILFPTHVFLYLSQGFIQGGGRRGTPPTPLYWHKYNSEVVLKSINSNKKKVTAKRACIGSRIFLKMYSSCQNIGNREVGATDGLPPIFEKSCMKTVCAIALPTGRV